MGQPKFGLSFSFVWGVVWIEGRQWRWGARKNLGRKNSLVAFVLDFSSVLILGRWMLSIVVSLRREI